MREADERLGWLGCTIDDRVAVERVVGEGGFGVVYRGQHLGFGEPVAVKCLKVAEGLGEAQREALLAHFQSEARLLHRLSRKTTGIVQALDVGAVVSPRGVWTPYIVMEWLEGRSLEDDLVHGPTEGRPGRPLGEAVALLAPVAQALAVAHAEGVAHLDIKPANIFLTTDGTVKLLDFGIAKVLSGSATFTGAATQGAGPQPFTPYYGAPEQFNRRHGATGPWTDVFALALVLIEVASGTQALEGDNPLQLYVASANTQFRPSLSNHGVRVSPIVDDVVSRALEVDPHQRFRDADGMWRTLLQALDPSPTAAVPSLLPLPTPVPEVQGPVSIVATGSFGPSASPLARTAQAGTGVPVGLNRVLTVLHAELSVTAELSELVDPELLDHLTERLMATLGDSVKALGGTVERVVDDRLKAVFGLYDDSATAAERAVHAALRMPVKLAELALPRGLSSQLRPGVRVGVSTGRVFVRAQQGLGGFELAATGATVKLAARLQQRAPAGASLVDRDTYRQVAGLFEVEGLEATAAEHRKVSSRSYRIKGVARDRYAQHVATVRSFAGRDTRFVGRAAEMEALASAMDTVQREPSAQLVTLVGPPGVGRSRLIVELVDRLEEQGWAVFAAPGSALHQETGYALAAALLRTRFHIHEDDDPAVMAAKIRRGARALRGLTPMDSTSGLMAAGLGDGLLDTEEVVSQLLRLLGVSEGEAEASPSAGEQGSAAKDRITAALVTMLRGATGPVAIVCDDLQWADAASLSLLEDLCLRLSDAPVLIACAARPVFIERRPLWGEGESAHQRITVGPLARRHLAEMVRDRLGNVADLSAEVVQRLADHADGNALTLVETLHLLVDAGVIDASDPERWQLHVDRMGELALPTTVQGIVQARLDRLDEPARMLLARASVVGRRFWDGALAELDVGTAAMGSEYLEGMLTELRNRGLIHARARSTFPDEQEFIFAEGATQSAAYEMLPAKERRELHGKVARWLESRTPSDAGAALIAFHHQRAAALPEAIATYRRAGAHAAALGQHAEALHAYEQACRIDDWISGDGTVGQITTEIFVGWEEPEDGRFETWPNRVALRMELGDVLRQLGRLDEAEKRYREAAARIVPVERRVTGAVDPLEVPRFQARLDCRLALLQKLRGNVDEPRALLARAVERAAEGGLLEQQAEAWTLLSSLHLRAGDLDECSQACLRALRVCRAIDVRGERWRQAVSKVLNALGDVSFRNGRLVRAERCFHQAVRVIDERRNPNQASHALNNVAALRYTQGDLEGARACFRRVLRLTERSGDLWTKMTVLGNLGEVEMGLGRTQVARECLLEATRLGEQIRAFLDLPECYRHLARVSLALDQHREALSAARRALELVEPAGARLYLPGVLLTAAEVCAGIGHEPAPGGDLADETRAVGRLVLQYLDGEHGSAVPSEQAARCRELLGDQPS